MKKVKYDLETELRRLKEARAQLRAIRKQSPEIYRGILQNLRRAEMRRQGKRPAGSPYLNPRLRESIRRAWQIFTP